MISFRNLLVVGTVMEVAYLSFYAVEDPVHDALLFIAVNALCFALLSWFALRSTRTTSGSADRGIILLIVGFALLFRLTLVFHQPVASNDVFRYVWDGRVAAAGYNPYEFSPLDPKLHDVRSESLPFLFNFPAMRTIYPPLAQLFFQFSYRLFGDSVTGMKLLLVVCDMASILLVGLICSIWGRAEPVSRSILRGNSPLLLYAWSPLPIMYIALDGHLDGLGIPLLLLCILLVLKQRGILSSIVLGLAALAKLYPLFVAPFLVRFAEGNERRWMPFVTVGVVALGYLLYLEPTGGVYESLITYNTTFAFNGAVYGVVKIILGSVISHWVCGALFLAWLTFLFFRRLPAMETILLVFVGFLIVSPTVHPWYFTWVAALVSLRWSLSIFLLLGLTNLSNIVVYRHQLNGVWEESAILIALEYVPFAILFTREIMRQEILRRA